MREALLWKLKIFYLILQENNGYSVFLEAFRFFFSPYSEISWILFDVCLFWPFLLGNQWTFQPGKPFSWALGHFLELIFFFFFFLFTAAPVAHGSSQASHQIRAIAAGLHHSHSNSGSELHLCTIPHLMATQDPQLQGV